MVPSRLLLAVVFVGFSAWVTAAPVPKEKPREGFIGVVKDGEMLLLTPDGKVAHTLKAKKPWPDNDTTAHPSPTASGFPVAVITRVEHFSAAKNKPGYMDCGVWLVSGPDAPDGKRVDVGEHKLQASLHWSRDGKRLIVHCFPPVDEMEGNLNAYDTCGVGKYLFVDPATGKLANAPFPAAHQLVGEAADGTFVTNGWWAETTKNAPRGPLRASDAPLFRVSADGKTVVALKHKLPARLDALDLAPDGKTLLCHEPLPRTTGDMLEVFDLTTGDTTRIEPADLKGKELLMPRCASWSPDGKRVAFGFADRNVKGRALGDWKVMVCDLDGKNCKELLSSSGDWALRANWK